MFLASEMSSRNAILCQKKFLKQQTISTKCNRFYFYIFFSILSKTRKDL